ncbi:uncharacterized protein B0H18DRAFT_1083768 [Fomitopsis serialis]|uniref:uncharacterized protein n=1 Tax=Fomitopsis serialis TaxID=139415 RepID=UPI002008C3B7|nr:uncharacterized protein B0H18DRAFT_1083768 [Neoantrodia serialis]KAH9930681.1 hypothetical protein B0H18DRAFT_1083768 [Neoantrodia serialis]
MARQLRSRASRPNYAALFQYDEDEDDGAGPSSQPVLEDEGDSGSDFAPGEVPDQAAEEDDDMVDEDAEAEEDVPEEEGSREPSIGLASDVGEPFTAASTRKPKAKAMPGLSSKPRKYALPSVHHRHRALPLFDRSGPVEKLVHCPAPFGSPRISPTNSWSVNPTILERISKAWGSNVGPGPLWDLLEDRAWFKESVASGGEKTADERYRRPRVHEGVRAQGLEILDTQQASPYLPMDVTATEKGVPKLPPPVPCSFGPYGRQTRIEMSMFETRKIADFIQGSKAHVFNPGAPVWALDWCPIHPDDRGRLRYKQYLAVAPFPSSTHSPTIGVRAQRPMHACIQIWSLSRSSDAMDVDESTDVDNGDDPGEMRCEMVICIESGPAFELKWCPLPANDAVDEANPTQPRKLGVIAGTFEDGSLSLYTIPDPASLHTDGSQPSQPIYVRFAEPLLRFELEETMCWGMDWANSEVIAVGCTNGSIAVFNIADALKRPEERTPTHYFVVHQSAIRTLAWVRAPVVSASGERSADHPTVITSGGYDGLECVTDIRDLVGNAINRTRDVVNSMAYSTWCGGPVTSDNENTIKAYSLSPSMLGRGQALLEPDGPVWSLAVSDYHPQLAVGVTDGSLLTTNTVRATRRGGANPFLIHRIYQLDYSRKDHEWRMLEKFLPKEVIIRSTKAAARAKQDLPIVTGAWPAQVGVQRAVWNSGNGLRAAPYLASSTGSGLCRVDWLLGRWNRDRIPYNGVDRIRGEVAVDGKEEDSDSDG